MSCDLREKENKKLPSLAHTALLETVGRFVPNMAYRHGDRMNSFEEPPYHERPPNHLYDARPPPGYEVLTLFTSRFLFA